VVRIRRFISRATVEKGLTPHRQTHEAGGADEISLAGLSIGAGLLKTTNLALKEEDSYTFALRNAADTVYRSVRLMDAYIKYFYPQSSAANSYMRTYGVTTYGWVFQAWDGAAYQACAELRDGYLSLLRMKAPNLTVGEYLKVGAGNVIESEDVEVDMIVWSLILG